MVYLNVKEQTFHPQGVQAQRPQCPPFRLHYISSQIRLSIPALTVATAATFLDVSSSWVRGMDQYT
jgi:hypothetical protein